MGRLYFSSQFFSKVFCGKSVKEAYLEACKWYASNVIAKEELHEVQVEFVKGINQVTLKLFAIASENEVKSNHCELCRELHNAFFINEANNCSVCNAAAFQRRLEQMIQIKSKYYHGLVSNPKE